MMESTLFGVLVVTRRCLRFLSTVFRCILIHLHRTTTRAGPYHTRVKHPSRVVNSPPLSLYSDNILPVHTVYTFCSCSCMYVCTDNIIHIFICICLFPKSACWSTTPRPFRVPDLEVDAAILMLKFTIVSRLSTEYWASKPL